VTDFNFFRMPSSSRVLPAITLAAILAQGIPVALLMNGTVLDALGLTSRI